MIVFFLPNIRNKGGVERATISLINELEYKKDLNVVILTLKGTKQEAGFAINPKVIVYSLEINEFKREYVQLFYRLNLFLKNNTIDKLIVVESMSLMLIYPSFYFFKNKTKLFVWEHFNYYNNNGRILRACMRKVAAKKADKIIVLTKRDLETWRDKLNIKNNIDFIYNISPFQNTEIDYNIESKTILAVGRFVKVKGFERLITIWSKLKEKYTIDDWKLKIVGGGELLNKLQQQINYLGLSESVYLLSNTSDIKEYYLEASFLCMTSHFEGLPMVLIEAQSFGLPTIAYDCYTGPSEIIDEFSGFLIEDNDEKSFIESIYKLIINQNTRIKMAKHSKDLSQRFEKNVIVDKWSELLEN